MKPNIIEMIPCSMMKRFLSRNKTVLVFCVSVIVLAFVVIYEQNVRSKWTFRQDVYDYPVRTRDQTVVSSSVEKECSNAESLWNQAVTNVRICPDSREHGVFNLVSLKAILQIPENCGSYVVFLPLDEVVPPSSSFGWALQVDSVSNNTFQGDQFCWKEIASEDRYLKFYQNFKSKLSDKSKRMFRDKLLGIDMAISSNSIERSKNNTKASCDHILGADEHPPSGVCGPQVLIIGSMKCGTNTVGKLLRLHPSVALKIGGPGDKAQGGTTDIWEIHHFTHQGLFVGKNPFSLESRKNYAKYIAHTDGVRNITFDKSPSYIDSQFHTGIAAAAKRQLPHARIVASVCDPAKRFWSHYNHLKRYNMTSHLPSSFEEVVKAAIHPVSSDVGKGMFEVGLYAPHILDWISEFGPEAILIVTQDELQENQSQVAHRLIRHVGLPLDTYPVIEKPWKEFQNDLSSYRRDDIPEEPAKLLYQAYEPSLRWLREIITQKDIVLSWKLGNSSVPNEIP